MMSSSVVCMLPSSCQVTFYLHTFLLLISHTLVHMTREDLNWLGPGFRKRQPHIGAFICSLPRLQSSPQSNKIISVAFTLQTTRAAQAVIATQTTGATKLLSSIDAHKNRVPMGRILLPKVIRKTISSACG